MEFNDITFVYDHLYDDISKQLFMKRMEYAITLDNKRIANIDCKLRNLSADIEYFFDRISEKRGNKVVAFGAGNIGIALAKGFPGLFSAMIDNNKKTDIEPQTHLNIYSLSEFMEKYGIEDVDFVITMANKKARIDVTKQLRNCGVKAENILILEPADWRNNCSQYFDLFNPDENEVFVDCGCFDGSTAFRFAGWCGSLSYDKIICFEPEPILFERCKKVLERLSNCEIYPFGVSDKSGMVSFLANAQEDARIVTDVADEGIQNIHVVCLDEFLKEQRVTFLKMDIEGAEYDALLGASKIIKEQKPKLAICIYHDRDHLVKIPKLLLDLRPDYRLFIRHYSLLPNETILYAV